MKSIRFSKKFIKAYRRRVRHNQKTSIIFDQRYTQFAQGERDYPLNDHALSGNMKGKRAFSITSDIRIIYEETTTEIIFLDIGTHAQVYR